MDMQLITVYNYNHVFFFDLAVEYSRPYAFFLLVVLYGVEIHKVEVKRVPLSRVS
jgi:hypothetical protein